MRRLPFCIEISVILLGVCSPLYCYDAVEKEEDIKRTKKEIEQQEWETSQEDWLREKQKIDEKIEAQKFQRQRMEIIKQENRKAEERAYQRKLEDRRRGRL